MHHMHALWSNVAKRARVVRSDSLVYMTYKCIDPIPSKVLHLWIDCYKWQIIDHPELWRKNGSLPLNSVFPHLVMTNVKRCFAGITLVAAPKIMSASPLLSSSSQMIFWSTLWAANPIIGIFKVCLISPISDPYSWRDLAWPVHLGVIL